MNIEWLRQAVVATEVESLGRPHIVVVDDPVVGTLAAHGPFANPIDACREADLIMRDLMLEDADYDYPPPVVTVVPLMAAAQFAVPPSDVPPSAAAQTDVPSVVTDRAHTPDQ